MKIPARCNKRTCHARRPLSKRPEFYKYWPTCHKPGCDGLMYVDEYRLRKGEKDNAPVCRDPLCKYVHPNFKQGRPMHRVSTKGCSGHEDYILNMTMKPKSKHSPRVDCEDDVASF